ncbi:MAG: hypothetical protein KF710_09795, partial [Rhodocyclaceae bacterium]|nr:hypothetical protein [Rhodocyclaceae bacterium]
MREWGMSPPAKKQRQRRFFVSKLRIRKVAVLGAGVMGAQIAAHCANADVPVL